MSTISAGGTGWMLERFATRTVFGFATVASLAGTAAPSYPLLLVARVAQAVGTAVIMPLLLPVAMTLVPAARRGTVMGLIVVVMAVGPALGPTLGGGGGILSFRNLLVHGAAGGRRGRRRR